MPKLILVRGLPGSGKSTLAKAIINSTPNTAHVEADMFFTNEVGVYTFNIAFIQDAHLWCQLETKRLLLMGKDVYVTNTFTRLWELAPYIELGRQLECTITIIECTNDFGNIHNVPEEVIANMTNHFDDVNVFMDAYRDTGIDYQSYINND